MPDRPVVSLIGDGGIQFSIGELATGVELRLPVPILLWNNQGYGEIKAYMQARNIPTIGVDIYTPDFGTIAWGAIFILLGFTAMFESLPEGTGAVGIGIILIGLNLARKAKGLAMSTFTTTVGILAVLLGGLEMAQPYLQLPFELPIFPILLVALGLIILVRQLMRNR